MTEEQWRTIPEFPKYEISSKGEIYNSHRRIFMRTSSNNFRDIKITLTDYDGSRHTRSVALLVAQAFVNQPNYLCDCLVRLDGDMANVDARNLAWRPRWFAWKYSRQLRVPQPTRYHNLPVFNITEGIEYESVVEAGMIEGLLFENIWVSTYRGSETYPYGNIFEIIKRV